MDTRNKRASALGIALAFRLALPAPDATIDQADRQDVAYSYAGISATEPFVPGAHDALCMAREVLGLPRLAEEALDSPQLVNGAVHGCN